jgi:putative flavoprotein involved in K+ transport
MKRIHTVVIGAGQAGLAMSRCLTELGVEHVVIERGRIAQRWSERWASLRLLSPNWMTRLPRWQYRGSDPDGFMKRDEVIGFLRDYACSFGAPVQDQTEVLSVRPSLSRWGARWSVATDRGTWLADHVVIATGHCQQPRIPACARDLHPDILQLSTLGYRDPDQLPRGGVLVIGASASGVQLARELLHAGRRVVVAAGRHARMPRRYRGRDIHFWLDRIGVMRRALTDVREPATARREPSLQLAAGSDTLDLQTLADSGAHIAGRLTHLDATKVAFAEDLPASVNDADRRMRAILGRIDRHIAAHGAERRFPAEAAPRNIDLAAAPRALDLAAERIGTVLWATGYQRSYPWLHAPVFDAHGEIRETRGRAAARGLYVLGLQFMIRRNSSLIDGVGRDAEEIATEIAHAGRRWKEAA